jgi:hypothetical protein
VTPHITPHGWIRGSELRQHGGGRITRGTRYSTEGPWGQRIAVCLWLGDGQFPNTPPMENFAPHHSYAIEFSDPVDLNHWLEWWYAARGMVFQDIYHIPEWRRCAVQGCPEILHRPAWVCYPHALAAWRDFMTDQGPVTDPSISSYGESIPEIRQALIANVEASRPDRIKASYERTMQDAGLAPAKTTIWRPPGVT